LGGVFGGGVARVFWGGDKVGTAVGLGTVTGEAVGEAMTAGVAVGEATGEATADGAGAKAEQVRELPSKHE